MKKYALFFAVIPVVFSHTAMADVSPMSILSLSSADINQWINKGYKLSVSSDTQAACTALRNQYNQEFSGWKRTDCFKDGNTYKYFLCDASSACAIDWVTQTGVSIPEVPMSGTSTGYIDNLKSRISGNNISKIETFLQNLQAKQSSKTKDQYISYVDAIVGKLNTLKGKYSENQNVLDIVEYLKLRIIQIKLAFTKDTGEESFWNEVRGDGEATTNPQAPANTSPVQTTATSQTSNNNDYTLGSWACVLSELSSVTLTNGGYISLWNSSRTLGVGNTLNKCLQACDLVKGDFAGQSMYCHYEGKLAKDYAANKVYDIKNASSLPYAQSVINAFVAQNMNNLPAIAIALNTQRASGKNITDAQVAAAIQANGWTATAQDVSNYMNKYNTPTPSTNTQKHTTPTAESIKNAAFLGMSAQDYQDQMDRANSPDPFGVIAYNKKFGLTAPRAVNPADQPQFDKTTIGTYQGTTVFPTLAAFNAGIDPNEVYRKAGLYVPQGSYVNGVWVPTPNTPSSNDTQAAKTARMNALIQAGLSPSDAFVQADQGFWGKDSSGISSPTGSVTAPTNTGPVYVLPISPINTQKHTTPTAESIKNAAFIWMSAQDYQDQVDRANSPDPFGVVAYNKKFGLTAPKAENPLNQPQFDKTTIGTYQGTTVFPTLATFNAGIDPNEVYRKAGLPLPQGSYVNGVWIPTPNTPSSNDTQAAKNARMNALIQAGLSATDAFVQADQGFWQKASVNGNNTSSSVTPNYTAPTTPISTTPAYVPPSPPVVDTTASAAKAPVYTQADIDHFVADHKDDPKAVADALMQARSKGIDISDASVAKALNNNGFNNNGKPITPEDVAKYTSKK